MAYQSNSRPHQQNPSAGAGRRMDQQGKINQKKKIITPKPLPENYVEEAERVIEKIAGSDKGRPISSSKLRNLFSLIIDIYHAERLRSEKTMEADSVFKLRNAQIRILYEAGREKSVEAFVSQSNLLGYLKDIQNDREKFLRFTHYMEALVAYHRFYHLNEG